MIFRISSKIEKFLTELNSLKKLQQQGYVPMFNKREFEGIINAFLPKKVSKVSYENQKRKCCISFDLSE